MGYDIYLSCPHCQTVCKMEESFEAGGTYDCHLSVTYNYAALYADVFPPYEDTGKGSIRWLYGKTGAATLEALKMAVEALGTEEAEDYWNPTPGNAGSMLARLLTFAEAHPEAEWSGD